MGAGTSFFSLIMAEMIGASRGLGWLVRNAQMNFQMPNVIAAVVLIALLNYGITTLFGAAEARLFVWRQKSNEG